MKKIGLVTVLFKSDNVLEDFFKSIASQTHKDYILFLVDNQVNEVTNNLIEEFLSKYKITDCRHIKNEDNAGVAEGNNIGIRLALKENCSHILILNNDIVIEQETNFSHMLEICSTQAEKIIVPKIFYYDTYKIWMAGGTMNKWRALGIHHGDGKDDSPKYNIAKHITYAPTCYMLVDKEVFEMIGLMDAKYFAYYDDTDFVYRALQQGFKMYYEPSLSVLHKVSSSTGPNPGFYIYYGNRNKIYFIRKNFKGFLKYFALGYTLFTRIFWYLRLDGESRNKLIKGLKDGFQIPI